MDGIDFRQYGYLFLLDRPEDVAVVPRGARAPASRSACPRASSRSRRRSRSSRSSTPEGLLARDVLRARRLRVAGVGRAVVRARDRRPPGLRGDRRSGSRTGASPGSRRRRARFACGTVVCCAGAWSHEVAAMAGVDLPVEGEKRWMWFSPGGRRPAGAAAADDRLLHLVLLPPRRPGPRLRREGADAGGGRRARGCAGCRCSRICRCRRRGGATTR